MNTLTEKIVGSRFVAEVAPHFDKKTGKTVLGLRPMDIEEDSLVRGKPSVRILVVERDEDKALLRRGEKYLVEVRTYHVPKESGGRYRTDSRGLPMVFLRVNVLGQVESFFRNGEWITSCRSRDLDELLSRVPALRDERYYLTPEGMVARVENILTSTEDGTKTVRRRVMEEFALKAYQDEKYEDVYNGFIEDFLSLSAIDKRELVPPELPKELLHLRKRPSHNARAQR
jgi:hypothetical protein